MTHKAKYEKRYASESKETDDDGAPVVNLDADEDDEAKQDDKGDTVGADAGMDAVAIALARAGRMDTAIATPPSQKIVRKRSGAFDGVGDSVQSKKPSSASGSVCDGSVAGDAAVPVGDTSTKSTAPTKGSTKVGE